METNELIVAHGSDIGAMLRSILDRSGLEHLIPPGALVALKPNLVVSKDASSGATTHPEIAETLIAWLRERGFARIEIIEGSWVGDSTSRAFEAAGYSELSKRSGVPLADLQRDTWKRYDAGAGWKIAVCDRAMQADFLINLPVIKGHCQTGVTCSLKNLKGCMPDDEKSRFHSEGLHEPIARLNRILKPGFIIADGICGDLDFEEGGNPVRMNRIVAGRDPVLLDAYACALMGHEIADIPYIGLAEEYGVGRADLGAAKVTELGDVESARAVPARSGKVRALAVRVDERSACSACYAALIHGLARLDERRLLKRLDATLAAAASPKIAIGRDFREVQSRTETEAGAAASPPSSAGLAERYDLGCGSCTRDVASRHVPGCPPNAAAVASFLERALDGAR